MPNPQFLVYADLSGAEVGVQHTPAGQGIQILHTDIRQRLAACAAWGKDSL